MDDTQPTRGPWKPCRSHEDYNGPLFPIDPDETAEYAARPFVSIDSVNGSSVVSCHDLATIRAADAHLLASAPDLLAALMAVIGDPDVRKHMSGPQYQAALAAVRKSRGQA